MTTKKRLIAALYRDIPLPRMVAAMGFILQARRERQGIDTDEQPLVLHEWEQRLEQFLGELEQFLGECSIWQLREFRKIAKGLTYDEEPGSPSSIH
jgi:hypothetical protein